MTELGQREFERILRERDVRTVFQPIASLGSRAITGYEALVRGPAGSPLASADALIEAAYAADRVAEFDWLARAAACRTALAEGLSADPLLFINMEPIALDSDCPRDLWPDIERAFARFQVVLEVTERSLDRDPGTLLDGLDRHRHMIAGFALDDVSSDPATLSMLPLVAPAVIKLDLSVTQAGPDAATMAVLDIVHEESERTGAVVLCEGIETDAHLATALSLGASLGQGHRFGRPEPPAGHAGRPVQRVLLRADTARTAATPFHALGGHVIGRCGAELLTALTAHLQSYAAAASSAAVVLEHFPHLRYINDSVIDRLADLAAGGAMTAILGAGVPADWGRGIRRTRPAASFVGEWAVVVLTPSSAAALLARAIDGTSDFEYGLTHDRQRVIAAARCLARKLDTQDPR